MKHHYIVCYDIASNQRRYHVDRTLAQYGHRIQFSVYEIVIAPWQLTSLRSALGELIDPEADKLHYYPICFWCRKRAQLVGAANWATLSDITCIC